MHNTMPNVQHHNQARLQNNALHLAIPPADVHTPVPVRNYFRGLGDDAVSDENLPPDSITSPCSHWFLMKPPWMLMMPPPNISWTHSTTLHVRLMTSYRPHKTKKSFWQIKCILQYQFNVTSVVLLYLLCKNLPVIFNSICLECI